ncbi:M1 family metallopeptidase [Lactobacillus alvi]|uniref:Aminopeptidase n=1 Tax=Limosilactobacillus alvi TaxID=990412 RepID=A0ABS2EPF6_9LACO|nr:M1 family metallopeptidase [Limosilactobacillus alvi]MBM6754255.1 M1 family metallopeptidase [Limosilactobacillus alvi]
MAKRLLASFVPEHYDLLIDINRKAKTIKGTTTIVGKAKETEIAVNQKFLQVSQVLVDGQPVPFELNQARETIEIKLAKQGPVTLTIDYQAPLTDTMMGIYPSYYDVAGERKQLVGTQFETTFARQAFPCVDEPAAKATFSLAIKFDEHPGETIIANMPEDHVTNGVHYFQETVKMSTYLVAFAFGEMQKKLTTTKSGVQVGVFATKAHQAKELDFALDIAKRAIEFYEDFYQTKYPLPHSWQLALPDFSAGAMENWGLVTYREAYLLLDPDNTALDTKRVVATVITHELAHQWFGDLVTMNWWDDLWLNESFANMMEYLSVDALQPDWHIWELFQTSEAPMALQRDATDGVQSVHVDVEDPREIDAIFDGAIVYAKGSRLLVMVRSLIGDDALRAGLKNYFAAHQYGNAKGDDLWQALGEASGMNIGAIMKAWLNQPGYPVVEAKVVDGYLTLHQKQFFIGDGQDQNRLWPIPLNANFKAPKLMEKADLDLGDYQSLRQAAGKPLRLNDGNNSHLIVKYAPELLDDILDHLNELDHITQLQLLQDLRLLAEAHQISYADLVGLLGKFKASQSAIVNDALYRIASKLRDFIVPNTPSETNLKQYFATLSADQTKRLGWKKQINDDFDAELMRPTILSAALYAEDSAAIAAAHALFKQHSAAKLPADVRALVLQNEVVNFGSGELFDQLLTDYQQTSDPSYKQDLCFALTKTKDTTLIGKLIDRFEDAKTIKPQDLRAWYRGLLANPAGQQAAWDWIRDEWDWLDATVGGDMEFATFITVTSAIFHTPARLAEFKAFFEPKVNTPGLTREIQMDVKVVETKVALVQAEAQAVNEAVTRMISK